jgi:tetratricopeptide (TPR) repeat protein
MNPRNILSANNLAALLADHKADAPNLERAFLLSREFEKDAPHPLFLDTLGWVRLKMGHLDDAVRLMRQAIAKAPDLPMLNYHLGAALYQSGRNVEAKVYLAKALKSTEHSKGDVKRNSCSPDERIGVVMRCTCGIVQTNRVHIDHSLFLTATVSCQSRDISRRAQEHHQLRYLIPDTARPGRCPAYFRLER